jgi:hypothetical protein
MRPAQVQWMRQAVDALLVDALLVDALFAGASLKREESPDPQKAGGLHGFDP